MIPFAKAQRYEQTRPVDAPLRKVEIREAKAHLSELLLAVEGGQVVEILRGGRPIARLVPVGPPLRELGLDEGMVVIADDFDAPLTPGCGYSSDT